MTPPLYDAHMHLQLPPLMEDADAIVETLARSNVRRIVVNGTREEDWNDVAQLAQKHEIIVPAFGLHPWHAAAAKSDWKGELRKKLEQFPFCIGEIGLDKWIHNPDLEKQTDAFVFQLNEAKQRQLPVQVHCLKAWGLILEVLEREGPFPRGLLLHSYGGSMEMVPRFVELGAYFSISGHFAHERKEKQREVFRKVPVGRLLIETDAPDMLPPEQLQVAQLHKNGKSWNHPANISAVYCFAAGLRGVSVEELAAQVETNFLRFFGGEASQVVPGTD